MVQIPPELEQIRASLLESVRCLSPSRVTIVGSMLDSSHMPSDLDVIVVSDAFRELPPDIRRGLIVWEGALKLDVQPLTPGEFEALYPIGSSCRQYLDQSGWTVYER